MHDRVHAGGRASYRLDIPNIAGVMLVAAVCRHGWAVEASDRMAPRQKVFDDLAPNATRAAGNQNVQVDAPLG